jgi:hypothetical protein
MKTLILAIVLFAANLVQAQGVGVQYTSPKVQVQVGVGQPAYYGYPAWHYQGIPCLNRFEDHRHWWYVHGVVHEGRDFSRAVIGLPPLPIVVVGQQPDCVTR